MENMVKTIYHGSDRIVDKPMYGVGKEDNDYGSGFYTTEDIEKAREWAVINGNGNAICNEYRIDLKGLNVLNLDDYGTLVWISEVVAHRGAKTAISNEVGNRLVEKYKIDTSDADVIIGYRADDSYITVMEAFLNNEVSVDEVDRMFRKGELGHQLFIKSEKAFDAIEFVGYEEVPLTGLLYGNADAKARREVNDFLNNRKAAIQIEGFVPIGITAREAIKSDFEYNKEYHFYMLVECSEKQTFIMEKGGGRDDI